MKNTMSPCPRRFRSSQRTVIHRKHCLAIPAKSNSGFDIINTFECLEGMLLNVLLYNLKRRARRVCSRRRSVRSALMESWRKGFGRERGWKEDQRYPGAGGGRSNQHALTSLHRFRTPCACSAGAASARSIASLFLSLHFPPLPFAYCSKFLEQRLSPQ